MKTTLQKLNKIKSIFDEQSDDSINCLGYKKLLALIEDEKNKEYDISIYEIRQLALKNIEGCDGCSDFEEKMWNEGFVRGFLVGMSF